jgi:hypothetical protein
MIVELVERLQPDLVAMSVWSTYYQLADIRPNIGNAPLNRGAAIPNAAAIPLPMAPPPSPDVRSPAPG